MAQVRLRFLWQFPYIERTQGVLDGMRLRGPLVDHHDADDAVPRGPVRPLGPPELAALAPTRDTSAHSTRTSGATHAVATAIGPTPLLLTIAASSSNAADRWSLSPT